MFYTEIQDDRRKYQENDFWEKLPDDSVCKLRIKIAPKSLYLAPFFETNMFLCFTGFLEKVVFFIYTHFNTKYVQLK